MHLYDVQTCLSAHISIYPNVHMFLELIFIRRCLRYVAYFEMYDDVLHKNMFLPCRKLSKQINTCLSNEIFVLFLFSLPLELFCSSEFRNILLLLSSQPDNVNVFIAVVELFLTHSPAQSAQA